MPKSNRPLPNRQSLARNLRSRWSNLSAKAKNFGLIGSSATVVALGLLYGPTIFYFMTFFIGGSAFILFPDKIERWFDDHQIMLGLGSFGALVGGPIVGPLFAAAGAWVGYILEVKYNQASNLARSYSSTYQTIRNAPSNVWSRITSLLPSAFKTPPPSVEGRKTKRNQKAHEKGREKAHQKRHKETKKKPSKKDDEAKKSIYQKVKSYLWKQDDNTPQTTPRVTPTRNVHSGKSKAGGLPASVTSALLATQSSLKHEPTMQQNAKQVADIGETPLLISKDITPAFLPEPAVEVSKLVPELSAAKEQISPVSAPPVAANVFKEKISPVPVPPDVTVNVFKEKISPVRESRVASKAPNVFVFKNQVSVKKEPVLPAFVQRNKPLIWQISKQVVQQPNPNLPPPARGAVSEASRLGLDTAYKVPPVVNEVRGAVSEACLGLHTAYKAQPEMHEVRGAVSSIPIKEESPPPPAIISSLPQEQKPLPSPKHIGESKSGRLPEKPTKSGWTRFLNCFRCFSWGEEDDTDTEDANRQPTHIQNTGNTNQSSVAENQSRDKRRISM